MARREKIWESKQKWAPIKVKENMSKDITRVKLDASATDVARLMRDQKVGCVPIMNDGQVLGVLTDRDLTCRVIAEGRDPSETTVESIMTKDVDVCFEDDLLADAAAIMEKRQVRRLPVLNRNKELAGMLTADDLAWHTNHELLGRVIASVYEPHR